jgi:hypothetical protein
MTRVLVAVVSAALLIGAAVSPANAGHWTCPGFVEG